MALIYLFITCILIILYFSFSNLEVLSTIEEVYGPVRIQSLPSQVTDFPYLRNLRIIDTTNTSTPLELVCTTAERRESCTE